MKNILIITVSFCMVSTVFADSQHSKSIHQSIVTEAYNLLKNRYIAAGGDVSDLQAFELFLREIKFGAKYEDEFDPIYYYHNIIPGGVPNGAPLTHFWDGDKGEDQGYDVLLNLIDDGINLSDFVNNAWTKARVYLFGSGTNVHGYEWWDTLGNSTYLLFYKIDSNTSLLDFYETGSVVQYDPLLNKLKRVNYYEWYYLHHPLTISLRILGHIAHLLADMSVPAHTLIDPHLPGNADSYEQWVGNDNGNIHFLDTLTGDDGFMPYITCYDDYEALFYLFFTMNQITQHFKSDDRGGNDAVLPQYANELIIQKLLAWGDPPNSVNKQDIANKTFDFCVGATASLFYWFGIRTGILKTEIKLLQYEHEITNPSFTIKSTNTITLLPGFEFEAKNEHDEFKALILDCDQLSGQIP